MYNKLHSILVAVVVLYHVVAVLGQTSIFDFGQLKVCIAGEFKSFKVTYTDGNRVDIPFPTNNTICCETTSSQHECTWRPILVNGPVTFVSDDYVLWAGEFDQLNNRFSGPVVYDTSSFESFWDPQRHSKVYSATKIDMYGAYCLHGIFHLRNQNQTVNSLVFQYGSLSINTDANREFCSPSALASLDIGRKDDKERSIILFVADVQQSRMRHNARIILKRVGGKDSVLIGSNNQELYYGFDEKPFKLFLYSTSSDPVICVLTTAQRTFCGVYDTAKHQWTHKAIQFEQSTPMYHISSHASAGTSIQMYSGVNFHRIQHQNCIFPECYAEFEIDGTVHFSSATLNKDGLVAALVSVVNFELTNMWIAAIQGYIFTPAAFVLSIVTLVAVARGKTAVLERTIPVAIILSVAVSYPFLDILHIIPLVLLLICNLLQHANTPRSKKSDRLLLVSIFCNVILAVVPKHTPVELYPTAGRMSYLYMYGLYSFMLISPNIAAIVYVVRLIRRQPKNSRKLLISLLIAVIVMVIAGSIAIPLLCLVNMALIAWFPTEVTAITTITIVIFLLPFLGWLIVLVLSRNTFTRLPIQTKAMETFYAYSAIHMTLDAVAALSFVMSSLPDANVIIYYRITIVAASVVVMVVAVAVSVTPYIRTKVKALLIERELKQIREANRKINIQSNGNSDVSTLRKRLLDDLDLDLVDSNGSAGSSAQGSGSAASIRSQEYQKHLEVLFQLAERCFIPIKYFRFHRLIGHGAYGVVREALWHTIGTTVAVKVLKSVDEEAKTEFLREASILSELRHPNVIMFLGVSLMHDTSFCIVTEYASNGCLQSILLRGTPLPWNTKIRFCMEIARALGYLHGCTPIILHRDLKSKNILLDENMSVKLCDFGLAKHDQGMNTTNIGTVHFMAPEIIKGESYSSKCDIYSFAIVMWEILYQREPYDDVMNNSSTDEHTGSDLEGRKVNQFTLPTFVLQGLRPTEHANQRQVLHNEKDSGDDTRNTVPEDIVEQYCQIMRRCWASEPDERPDVSAIAKDLKSLLI